MSTGTAAKAPRPYPRVSVLLGRRAVGSKLGADKAGLAQAFPLHSHASGNISSISVYLDSSDRARKLVVGLYSNDRGHPGSRLTTGALRAPKPGAWDRVKVRPAAVRRGATYWLALLGRGGKLVFRGTKRGTCHSETSRRHNLRSLPSSWAKGSRRKLCPLSAYASGSRGAPGSTTPISTGTTPGAGSTPTPPAPGSPGAGGSGSSAAFPLQVSANGRYLETAGGTPWLMVGDSPQSVIGNLSETNADAYLDDRAAHGFNAVWINLLCASYTACASNGETYDGVAPFTSGSSPGSYNFADPNSTYFTRAHDIIAHAEADGIEVLLDPVETGTPYGGSCTSPGSDYWLQGVISNGSTKDYQYGQYLGNEFKDLHNVIWMSGNDFQCIETTADNNDVKQVAEGIANTDPGALQTLETDYGTSAGASSSLVDGNGVATGWSSIVQLNGSYAYAPTYAEDLAAYSQATIPMFLEEANYEGQHNDGADGCAAGEGHTASDPLNCRRQEWWTMTSGATGQMYGGPCYGITNSTSLSSCDTAGVTQLGYQTTLLEAIAWWTLVPYATSNHTLVTAGYGSCPTTGSMDGDNCVTDAESSDQTLALIYDPEGSTITVNLGSMAAGKTTTARWYDPANGTFTSISGSPFSDSGAHQFTPPGKNSAGDNDWVLILQAS